MTPRGSRPDLGERALAEAKRARRAALRCERIERAAIRTADGTVYSVRRPLRHHHVIHLMHGHGCERPDRHEQGFVTDRGRFVGREEALAIATAAGQIQYRCGGDDIRLYSENLWMPRANARAMAETDRERRMRLEAYARRERAHAAAVTRASRPVDDCDAPDEAPPGWAEP